MLSNEELRKRLEGLREAFGAAATGGGDQRVDALVLAGSFQEAKNSLTADDPDRAAIDKLLGTDVTTDGTLRVSSALAAVELLLKALKPQAAQARVTSAARQSLARFQPGARPTPRGRRMP